MACVLLLPLLTLSAGCEDREPKRQAAPGAPPRLWTASHFVRTAFSDTLYGGPVILDRADSVERIRQHLDEMSMPAASFFDAYSKIEILNHRYDTLKTVNRPALQVDYEIDDRALTGYAYFRPGAETKSNCAALIIPGSGLNQSTAILVSDVDNYHYNIAKVVGTHCDLFVYVKPNEDFLAIHNGVFKLDYRYIIGHLINNGGSYSALYLVHTLAIAKYLKESYDKLLVVGISQGGKAALLNSLQSEPYGTIVSSGFSILEEELVGMGLGQIMIPGLNGHYRRFDIYRTIAGSSTRFLFTYGKLEEGMYGVEARENITRDYYRDLDNVEFHVHNRGHRFPPRRIGRFLLTHFGE